MKKQIKTAPSAGITKSKTQAGSPVVIGQLAKSLLRVLTTCRAETFGRLLSGPKKQVNSSEQQGHSSLSKFAPSALNDEKALATSSKDSARTEWPKT